MKKYLALLLVISTVFLAVSCIAENNSSAPEGSDVSVPNESSRPQKEEDEYSPIGSFTFGIRSDEGYIVLEYRIFLLLEKATSDIFSAFFGLFQF